MADPKPTGDGPLAEGDGRGRRCAAFATGLVLFVAGHTGGSALAQGIDPAVFDLGLKVYKTAVCEFCHGWSGHGGEAHDDFSGRVIDPGPSLVTTRLDRQSMVELIACGTPGGFMPQYLASAWTPERRCYGKVAEDLPPDSRPARASPYARPPGPYAALSAREIDAVVAFVREMYQGKQMTLANCLKYHGANSRSCALYR